MFSPRRKGPLRTYSRQKTSVQSDDRSAKRRRLSPSSDATPAIPDEKENAPKGPPLLRPSSPPPPDPTVFSDPLPRTPASSPPSSPPAAQTSSPIRTAPRSAFCLPRRKRPRQEARPGKLPKPGDRKPVPQKKPRLVQMQIDLGGDVRKTCKVCGMEYVPSSPEDATLHKKFHAMNLNGVDLSKAVVESLRKNQIWDGGNGSFIATVSRKDSLALKNKAKHVLGVVNAELSAVEIKEHALWSQVSIPQAQGPDGRGRSVSAQSESGSSKDSVCDRFKVYLCIQGQNCVGLCLGERISESYGVLGAHPKQPSGPGLSNGSSVSIDERVQPAVLGISRIWTSKLCRKKGIARAMLDCAAEDFVYGMMVPKQMVAFSQPTESGANLARKWFGRESGWHVYVD